MYAIRSYYAIGQGFAAVAGGAAKHGVTQVDRLHGYESDGSHAERLALRLHHPAAWERDGDRRDGRGPHGGAMA